MKKKLTFLPPVKIVLWIILCCLLYPDPSLANPDHPTGKALFHLFFNFVAIDVSGTVTNEDGNALIGVNVLVKGTTQGTTTDIDGKFELSGVPDDAILVVSYVGYQTQEVTVAGNTVLNITMTSDSQLLDEVVVVGYGSQSKRLLTTSISKLDNSVLDNIPFSNSAYALQGNIPGVRVTSTSGMPGADPIIIIRGGGSLDINSSTPLYVIDGVISPDMRAVNSSDIESIQVLKDAASTAIYGARGSNGVIIITTKTGETGKTKIVYNSDLILSHYPSNVFKMLGARDFIYFNRLAIDAGAKKIPSFAGILKTASSAGTGNDLTNNTFFTTQYLSEENKHKLNEGWDSMPDPLDESKTIIFKGTNWRDVMFKPAISHSHSLAATGGNDISSYRVSLGYLDNNGIYINTGFKRLSLDMKGGIKIRDNLSVNSHISFSKDKIENVSSERLVFGRLISVAPTVKYHFEDGTLGPNLRNNFGNPVYNQLTNLGGGSRDNISLSIGGQWHILPNLIFKPDASYLVRTDDQWSFTKSYFEGLNLNSARRATRNQKKYESYQFNGVLNYFTNYGMNLMAGYSFMNTFNDTYVAIGRDAATDHITTLNASAIPISVNSTKTEYKYIGFFSRLNYNYHNKYIININARYDGASNLGFNNKYGFFPGISFGWNINEESFWNSVNYLVPQFKIRVSYGVNGNVNGIGPYQSQGEFSVGKIYNGLGAINNRVLANADLKWERSVTADIGIDAGIFNNRVLFSIDVYNKTVNNLISQRSLPSYTGFRSILTNLGTIRNRGLDFDLSTAIFRPESKFKWNISLNGAFVRNKILKLPPNGAKNNRIGGVYVWNEKVNDYTWEGGLQEGGAIGDLYAFEQLGIYQNDQVALEGPYDELVFGGDKTKYGGDVLWHDFDRNDTIDTRDQAFMGNIYPKWTGGLINKFSYNGFNLLVRLDYMTGHIIDNYMWAFFTGQFAGELGLSADAGRSWTHEGSDTEIPKIWYGDYQQNLSRGNSIFYEKGDYISLREVTLAYSLPDFICDKLKINNLRINLTGQNIYYFTKYRGVNPEINGRENGSYPTAMNFMVGLQLGF